MTRIREEEEYPWHFCCTQVVFLTAYQFSCMLDIVFHSDNPRPSATGLPKDQVRCVNLVQKISNRTDCSLLVIKLFTNMFWIPSFFLTKEFNRERRVYQQTVTY